MRPPSALAEHAQLRSVRDRTHDLVAGISDEDLERVHSSLMSPLVWDLGHIAAFEDLWIGQNYGERELLRGDLAEVYDAFETPRSGRGELPYLRRPEAIEYLEQVRERTLEVLEDRGVGDGTILELVLRHEQQHTETMLQTIQLARLRGCRLTEATASPPRGETARLTGLELVDIPGGRFELGIGKDGFAYDNERPRHDVPTRDFRIGRSPVTNATYLHFVEGGGYQRREWWSDEGWAWKEEYDIGRPEGWTPDLRSEWRLGRCEPLHPDRPVIHVSWFEADAFTRAHGVRLPTEAEWEKAATWDQDTERQTGYPWGDTGLVPGLHANVDQSAGGPVPVGSLPAGASRLGVHGLIGDVWEWTSSEFGGYPGFVAHPYPQYSEVFFDQGYRVLRGGSWATRAGVATATFRNWDLPERRQIFAGLRIAEDAP